MINIKKGIVVQRYPAIKFFIKKAIYLLLLLVMISIVCFCLLGFSPIDPIEAYIGADAQSLPPSQIESLKEYWGLNDSYVTRYFKWIKGLASGNLGQSMIYNQPVANVIKERFQASLLLMSVSWVLSGVLGFSLGVIAAINKSKLIDKIIKMYCLTLASAPVFWVAILLLIVFSVWLGWFPMGLSAPISSIGNDVTLGQRIYHLVLPALALSLTGVANIALHTRQKLVDIFDSDYVLFAKSRGEGKWRILKNHGLRNILIPAITLQFASLSELFGGSTLAEVVFSYPGLGNTIVEAGIRADLTLLVGISLFSAIFVCTGNLMANILYAVIDPRIKESYNEN